MPEPSPTLQSPCINQCTLDERNVCVGCLRTMDEIIRWKEMGDEERARVLTRLRELEGRDPDGL